MTHKLILDLSKIKNSGLQGFVVIHNHNLGPALGGTRVWNYRSRAEALRDALRLSQAMTYKCAIARLPFGGGKGVLLLDPKKLTKPILKRYAEIINTLKGRFYTGEDVGLTEEQVQYMLKFSPYFIGKSGQAGDPSGPTVDSTLLCIKVALNFVFGDQKIANYSFAVKGVGKTGSDLAVQLAHAGAKVYVADIDGSKVKKIIGRYPKIQAVKPRQIDKLKVDVFCPCALGDDVTGKNVDKLRVKIVAGTANNQMETGTVADRLFKRGILHVPDYISNAGGLIDVADELLPGGFNKKRVLAGISRIKLTLSDVLNTSRLKKISPDKVALQLAQKLCKLLIRTKS